MLPAPQEQLPNRHEARDQAAARAGVVRVLLPVLVGDGPGSGDHKGGRLRRRAALGVRGARVVDFEM